MSPHSTYGALSTLPLGKRRRDLFRDKRRTRYEFTHEEMYPVSPEEPVTLC